MAPGICLVLGVPRLHEYSTSDSNFLVSGRRRGGSKIFISSRHLFRKQGFSKASLFPPSASEELRLHYSPAQGPVGSRTQLPTATHTPAGPRWASFPLTQVPLGACWHGIWLTPEKMETGLGVPWGARAIQGAHPSASHKGTKVLGLTSLAGGSCWAKIRTPQAVLPPPPKKGGQLLLLPGAWGSQQSGDPWVGLGQVQLHTPPSPQQLQSGSGIGVPPKGGRLLPLPGAWGSQQSGGPQGGPWPSPASHCPLSPAASEQGCIRGDSPLSPAAAPLSTHLYWDMHPGEAPPPKQKLHPQGPPKQSLVLSMPQQLLATRNISAK